MPHGRCARSRRDREGRGRTLPHAGRIASVAPPSPTRLEIELSAVTAVPTIDRRLRALIRPPFRKRYTEQIPGSNLWQR